MKHHPGNCGYTVFQAYVLTVSFLVPYTNIAPLIVGNSRYFGEVWYFRGETRWRELAAVFTVASSMYPMIAVI